MPSGVLTISLFDLSLTVFHLQGAELLLPCGLIKLPDTFYLLPIILGLLSLVFVFGRLRVIGINVGDIHPSRTMRARDNISLLGGEYVKPLSTAWACDFESNTAHGCPR